MIIIFLEEVKNLAGKITDVQQATLKIKGRGGLLSARGALSFRPLNLRVHRFRDLDQFGDQFWTALKLDPNLILDRLKRPIVKTFCFQIQFFDVHARPG
jgi:hypothetical protein